MAPVASLSHGLRSTCTTSHPYPVTSVHRQPTRQIDGSVRDAHPGEQRPGASRTRIDPRVARRTRRGILAEGPQQGVAGLERRPPASSKNLREDRSTTAYAGRRRRSLTLSPALRSSRTKGRNPARATAASVGMVKL